MMYTIHRRTYGSTIIEDFGSGFTMEEVKHYTKGYKLTEKYGDEKSGAMTFTRKNSKHFYIVSY